MQLMRFPRSCIQLECCEGFRCLEREARNLSFAFCAPVSICALVIGVMYKPFLPMI